MPPDVFQRLLQNLQATQKVYATLLEVAERKQQHILKNDIDSLREDLQSEERLAAEGSMLGLQRDALHQCCRQALNLVKGGETLTDLCRRLPLVWQDRFRKERDALARTIEGLHSANRINVALINNSLEMLEGLLTALFDAEPVSAYGPTGMRSRPELVHGSLNAHA